MKCSTTISFQPSFISKMELSTELEKYIQTHSSTEEPLLNHIYRQTNLNMVNPRMVSGHIQGLFLSLLSQLMQPSNILEIGTYTGYSAICLAKGLTQEGKLHTIEVNDEIAEFAKGNIRSALMDHCVVQHIGNALEIVPSLAATFDIIFIDGEKREYPDYFMICKDRLRNGGLLLADNVLWNGKVVDINAQNESATKAVMEFNKMVQNDKSFENVLLPIRDGIMMARKIL